MSHDAIRTLIECELATKVEVKLCDLMALIEERDRLARTFAECSGLVDDITQDLRRARDGSMSGSAEPLSDAEQEAYDDMAEREASGDKAQTKPDSCDETPPTEPIPAPAFVRQTNFTENAVAGAEGKHGTVSPWRASYTPNQCQLAVRLLVKGLLHVEIAAQTGVKVQSVYDIAKAYANQIAALTEETNEAKRDRAFDSLYRQMLARWEAAGKDPAVQPDNVPYKAQGKGSTDTTSVTKNMGHDSDHRKWLSPETRKALEEKGL